MRQAREAVPVFKQLYLPGDDRLICGVGAAKVHVNPCIRPPYSYRTCVREGCFGAEVVSGKTRSLVK